MATPLNNPVILSDPERAEGDSKDPRFALLEPTRKWVPHVSRLRHGKATNSNGYFYLKIAQALLLAIAVCFSTAASNSSSRFNDLGHRLMCTCSCAQLLGECNHVGCPESGHMRDELSAAIASGATDEQILTSFAAKYGATVLAAPTTHGFDLVAWIAPFAVFAAALLGTILLVRHWSVGRTQSAQLSDPTIDALREKIRRETGAGIDGGI
jgi:cytochrome c-type biogenesis protein CcmH